MHESYWSVFDYWLTTEVVSNKSKIGISPKQYFVCLNFLCSHTKQLFFAFYAYAQSTEILQHPEIF